MESELETPHNVVSLMTELRKRIRIAVHRDAKEFPDTVTLCSKCLIPISEHGTRCRD